MSYEHTWGGGVNEGVRLVRTVRVKYKAVAIAWFVCWYIPAKTGAQKIENDTCTAIRVVMVSNMITLNARQKVCVCACARTHACVYVCVLPTCGSSVRTTSYLPYPSGRGVWLCSEHAKALEDTHTLTHSHHQIELVVVKISGVVKVCTGVP